ncbi:aldo/keto reductase [Enterococcus hulanensis]|uniref:aldo/keto reductase n=1 Tax=Enterococcus TaxID=1350 RepID=UPI000B70BCAA|nr:MULTISPECIES: aldo/keto reductase [Enterococcus]MBO0410530.1 aldo/keto reductase [Enterococcus hulanensis]OTO21660.1 hypothetical protein A5875_003042 [Enterococcus sp. 3H8_DIV0648]
MDKIKIGNDLKVSEIGLGTINFGTKLDTDTAHLMLSKYVELGGNFLDTAINYAALNS